MDNSHEMLSAANSNRLQRAREAINASCATSNSDSKIVRITLALDLIVHYLAQEDRKKDFIISACTV